MEGNRARHRRAEVGRDQWESSRPPSCPSSVSKSTVQALWEASGDSLGSPCSGTLTGQEYTFEILHLLLQLLEDLVRLGPAEEDAVITAEPLCADLPREGPLRAGFLQPRPLPAAAIPRLPAGQFDHEPVHGRTRDRERCSREGRGERRPRSRGKRERAPGKAAREATPPSPADHAPRRKRAVLAPNPSPDSTPAPVPRRCRPSLTPGLPRCLLRSAAAMIGQKTLHSFFSPAPAKKRGRSPEPGGDSEVASGGLREPAALEEREEKGLVAARACLALRVWEGAWGPWRPFLRGIGGGEWGGATISKLPLGSTRG